MMRARVRGKNEAREKRARSLEVNPARRDLTIRGMARHRGETALGDGPATADGVVRRAAIRRDFGHTLQSVVQNFGLSPRKHAVRGRTNPNGALAARG